MISIPISIFSLTMQVFRAYFIQRGEDEMDPEPQLKTIILRIYPWMWLIVMNSVLLWTMIGGLISGYIFYGTILCFVFVYLLLGFLPKLMR